VTQNVLKCTHFNVKFRKFSWTHIPFWVGVTAHSQTGPSMLGGQHWWSSALTGSTPLSILSCYLLMLNCLVNKLLFFPTRTSTVKPVASPVANSATGLEILAFRSQATHCCMTPGNMWPTTAADSIDSTVCWRAISTVAYVLNGRMSEWDLTFH